jgi:D-alanyl-D-alanine carboxypeptidase
VKILLIDKDNPIPAGYKPVLEEVEHGYYMEKNAARCMKKLLEAARKDGITIEVFSAYRTYDYQQKLFDDDVQWNMSEGLSYEEAYKKTASSIALPGRSEHNAGLAADLKGDDWDCDNWYNFEKTSTFKWLEKNAPRFGFIIRYPKDKTQITNFIYEPWHFRYVGCPHAEIITRKGITLKEYLELCNCKFK